MNHCLAAPAIIGYCGRPAEPLRSQWWSPALTTVAGLCAFALLLLSATAFAASGPELGKPVEPFRITTLSGRQLTSTTQHGRVLIVNLWATWCAPCRQEMPEIEAFYAQYRKRGVDVVAVSVDDRGDIDAVRKVMAAYAFPAALAVESDLRALGRIRQVPATFVIDRNGVLRRNGWADAGIVDFKSLEKAVRPLLSPAPEPQLNNGE
jgi:thiol-disulfide isomerase/thioredoxin